MLDRTHPAVTCYANHVRRRYGRLTAFRLGYVLGELTEEPWSCPYDDERGAGHFNQGMQAGREAQARHAERAARE